MEDTATHDTAKVSDSAYSNSCSNSQSQRSGSGSGSGSTLGSTKSRHSRSSGSSSGYCGQPSTLSSGNETFPHPKTYKRNKGTDHKKKKKQKTTAGPPLTSLLITTENIANPSDAAMTPITEFEEIGGSEETVALPATTQVLEKENMIPAESTQTVKKSVFDLAYAVSEENDVNGSSLQSLSCEMNVEQMPSNIDTVLKVQIPEVTEFCAIVSMEDGIVMHTSKNLEHILGFPKNMWIGHSFIDFVHAKDHTVFASNVASGVVVPLTANRNARATLALKNIFFSRLRCYRGLASAGFSLADACDTYLPFQLTTTLREVGKASAAGHDFGGKSIFLVIAAKLVQSVYKYAEDVRVLPKFITKHLASCELSHVDPEAVPNLGYLPQDLIGRSVMDFYHPEDLPYLKEVYLTVVKEKEPIFRSKPYRFRVQNGGYVLLETEWSSFINPWTMKLEFVTGQHQALKGPVNPDVFDPPPSCADDDDDVKSCDEAMIEVNHIKEEIQCLLQQTINRATETVRVHAENRYKNLASFMHTLLDDMSKPNLKVDLSHGENATFFPERDSVMLGEISPHHDYYDSKSKSSTETPPSYTQLNYKENIQRFFESKPKTSVPEANSSLPSTDEEGKSLQVADSSLGSITATNRNHSSAVNDSGSGSGSGQSSGSNDKGDTSGDSRAHTSQTKKYSQSQGYYQPHHLTEALLYRHNEDMEKEMSRKHRETREHWAKSDRGKKSKKKDAYKLFQRQCQGMKRRGPQSWDVEPHKYAKQTEASSTQKQVAPQGVVVADNSGSTTSIYQGGPSMNIWPPFSVGVTPNQQPSCSSSPSFPATCTTPHLDLIPVYLIPTQSAQHLVHPGIATQESQPSDRGICAQISHNVLPQHAYVNPGVVFQPLNTVYGAPILYPSMTMLRPSERQPMAGTLDTAHKPQATQKTFSDTRGLQRAPSQATSLKAEPGSGMGSIASASIIRCTLSECSKKALPLFSPLGQASSNISHDGDKFKTIIKPKKTSTTNVYNETSSCSVLRDQSTQDGSCFSSFYSFLKSGKSDGSTDSSLIDAPLPNLYRWGIHDTDESRLRDIGESARPVLQEPPWLEKVCVTPDLVYRYQIENKSLDEVLAIDLKKLDSVRQPALVNDQLCQFYVDMELEGLTTRLMLDEGFTSSGGSSGEEATFAAIHRQPLSKSKKKRRRSIEYGKMTMVFEENAPIPPPVC